MSPLEKDLAAKEAALDLLLETTLSLHSLNNGQVYSRIHDDAKGDSGAEHELEVSFEPGDGAWVTAGGGRLLHFRGFFGGGDSLRTRNALKVLGEAIHRDNKTQTPKQGATEKEAALDLLLGNTLFLDSLSRGRGYSRRHDDAGGEFGDEHDLEVSLEPGDGAWVTVGAGYSLHFGGEGSPRVHNALVVLAEAIRRDNKELPQHQFPGTR